MTLEADVAALTTATTNLLNAVNVRKATLDQAVADATTQAALATTNGAAQVALAQAQVASAAQQASNAGASASTAASNKAAAQDAATLAQTYASQAQSTNPDSPIRLNPRKVTANFTVPADYNASSVGPIAVSEGITVTVADRATWSIT